MRQQSNLLQSQRSNIGANLQDGTGSMLSNVSQQQQLAHAVFTIDIHITKPPAASPDRT
jgi:hypothetical protein